MLFSLLLRAHPPQKNWKAVSGEEEILLPHPSLCVCLAFRFSQAHHFSILLSSACCGYWVQPGRSYNPMEHPTELTCDRTSSLYGHQAAHWKWSGDVESWLFALLGKAPRDFKSICFSAVRQECSVLSSFLPNVRQEGKFLEDISKPIFKCIFSNQPYRIYLLRAIVCHSVQHFFQAPVPWLSHSGTLSQVFSSSEQVGPHLLRAGLLPAGCLQTESQVHSWNTCWVNQTYSGVCPAWICKGFQCYLVYLIGHWPMLSSCTLSSLSTISQKMLVLLLLRVIPPSTAPQGETCPPTQAPNTAHHVQSAKVLLAKSLSHKNKL